MSKSVAVPGAPLTKREREVAGLIADGKTNREIADMLSISTETVKGHVTSVLRKWQMPHRMAAAFRYLEETGQLKRKKSER